MKILFLQPLVAKEKLWGKYAKEGGFIPPLGILSIMDCNEKQGHEVKIIDALAQGLSQNEIRKILQKEKFNLIGLPAFTNTILNTYETVLFCKKILPKAKIVVGGVHASVLPQQTMKECPLIDFLVMGEGEETTAELLNYLETGKPSLKEISGLVYKTSTGKIVLNEKRDLIKNLDTLPFPAYHLLDMEKYIPHPTQYKILPSFPVIAQRGCPYTCAFCSAGLVQGRKLRFKSVAYLLNEIEFLIKQYGAKGIHFQDSTFTVNREYVVDLCQEISKRGLKFKWDINTRVDCLDEGLLPSMKKAGLWMINFGLESGNQSSLDLLNKKITLSQIKKTIEATRKNKITTFSTWILGLPGEDEKKVRTTIKFAKEIGTELVLFFLPVPYPGTELVTLCQKFGGFNEKASWSDYDSTTFANPVYINPLLGKEKMKKLLKEAYLSYYFSPKIILRNLMTIENFTDLKRYFRGARAIFYGWII
ncbi:MAG: B12-binding domain-containing radical SAM protein [Patescibacteria group bacterium]|nr:B12-binding domain-containing radical SAM protein [Patescibacteria group bacterium]